VIAKTGQHFEERRKFSINCKYYVQNILNWTLDAKIMKNGILKTSMLAYIIFDDSFLSLYVNVKNATVK